jgi:hypothetical protein
LATKDAGSGLFVRDAMGINGNQVEVTNSLFTKGGIVGDWSQYMLFIFGDIQLVVDRISQ